PGEPVFQNPSLRPSCRMRGSRAERTLLKFRLAIEKDAQQTGLKWLKVLKVSKRNWPVKRSVNFRFLNKAGSVRQKPGRRTARGFSEGMVFCPTTGSARAEALNQRSKPRGSLALGSPSWLARNKQGEGPRQPAPVGSSSWREATVAGDRKSTRLNSSHLVISYAVFCL